MTTGDSPYRGQSSPRRCVEVEERIGACEVRLTPAALAFVPAELRDRIARLRRETEGRDDESVDARRAELADALEEAVERAAERELDVRALPTEHPSAPPIDDPWGPVGTEEVAEPHLTALSAAVHELDRGAEVVRSGTRLTARFTLESAPIVWSIQLENAVHARTALEVSHFAGASHWLATRIPEGCPPLSVQREGVVEAIGKALRLRSEVELDDPSFDGAFFVEGEVSFARAILTPAVRAALLARRGLGGFTFRTGTSTASLAWKTGLFTIVGPALLPGARVLVAVRRAFAELRLVRPVG